MRLPTGKGCAKRSGVPPDPSGARGVKSFRVLGIFSKPVAGCGSRSKKTLASSPRPNRVDCSRVTHSHAHTPVNLCTGEDRGFHPCLPRPIQSLTKHDGASCFSADLFQAAARSPILSRWQRVARAPHSSRARHTCTLTRQVRVARTPCVRLKFGPPKHTSLGSCVSASVPRCKTKGQVPCGVSLGCQTRCVYATTRTFSGHLYPVLNKGEKHSRCACTVGLFARPRMQGMRGTSA